MAAPEFFVPGVAADAAEAELDRLAGFAGCAPPPGERVFRIEWEPDGQRWTAEVGRPLRGEQVTRSFRGRPGQRFSDPATVLAIFPGVPWKVVTDAYPLSDVRSKWENPFFVGQPSKVEHFTPGQG